jgi:uncharacterized membrane protein YjjP (DUF1212 family)
MQDYKSISVVVFIALMACLFFMLYAQSFWLIVVLAAVVPGIVLIQVWVILRGKEEELPPDREERWYEHR